jgi:hypothetical protein
MLHSYMIYQRVLDDELMDIIQGNRNKPMADAYFNLMHMHKTYAEDSPTPEEIVKKGMMYSLYQPTMFMQYAAGEKSLESTRLETIFAEGNGMMNDGPIKTTHLMKHYSLSVGDLVVNVLDNDTFVCMPQGWHQLEDTTLELNVA